MAAFLAPLLGALGRTFAAESAGAFLGRSVLGGMESGSLSNVFGGSGGISGGVAKSLGGSGQAGQILDLFGKPKNSNEGSVLQPGTQNSRSGSQQYGQRSSFDFGMGDGSRTGGSFSAKAFGGNVNPYANALTGGKGGPGGSGGNSPNNITGPSTKDLDDKTKKSTDTLNKFGSSMEQFVQRPFGETTRYINNFNQSLTTLEGPFKALQGVFQHIGSYVGAFNPAQIGFFDRAVKDFQAAIGEILVPVMREGTKLFRFFGSAIAGLTPAVQPLIQTLSNVVDRALQPLGSVLKSIMGTVFAVSNAFNSLLEDLDPIFQQTADFNNVFAEVFDVFTEMVNLGVELMTAFRPLIQELMPVFQGLSQILKDIAARVRAFANEIRGLREYLGFKTFDKNATADGKAFVSTQTETTQSYLSRLQNNAFGLGAAADPSSRTAANTDRMADVLQRILDYMAGRLVEELSKLIEKISPDRIAGRAVEAASAAAGDYLGNLRAAIGTLGGGL